MNRTQAFQQLKRNKKRLKHGDKKKALQQSKQALYVIMTTEGEQG